MPLQPMVMGARYTIVRGHCLAREAGHAIVADLEAGIRWGDADPRRAARAMGW
jgi:hypothetical protein